MGLIRERPLLLDGLTRPIFEDMSNIVRRQYEGEAAFEDEPYLQSIVAKYHVSDGMSHIRIGPKDIPFRKLGQEGWKFHVSAEIDDLGKAWEIAIGELINHDPLLAAKVIGPMTALRWKEQGPSPGNAGKLITIYDDGIDHASTMELMRRLEQRLSFHGIRTGPQPPTDRHVPGSSYLSYRNDRDKKGSYSRDPKFNARGRRDPFAKFSIQPAAPLTSATSSPSQKCP